jgi:hypothetical protein
MAATTKKEIREFASRTSQAAADVQRLLREERHYLAAGRLAEFHEELQAAAEEISGCGSEVQNLIEARYAGTVVPGYVSDFAHRLMDTEAIPVSEPKFPSPEYDRAMGIDLQEGTRPTVDEMALDAENRWAERGRPASRGHGISE